MHVPTHRKHLNVRHRVGSRGLTNLGDWDWALLIFGLQVRLTLPETVPVGPPSDAEAVAVGAICAFLYSLFAVLPMNVVITGLAYTAQLVPHLWPYMKQCHKFNTWPAMELVGRSTTETQLSGESLGWMLPLSVFCPVYRWDQGLCLWWYSQFWKFIRPAAYFCEFQSQKFSSL